MLNVAQQYVDSHQHVMIEVHAAPHHAVRVELLSQIPERSIAWQCPDTICFIARQLGPRHTTWVLEQCAATQTAVTIVHHDDDWEPVDSLTVWGDEW